jgi:surface carbohydrate biosynthesis protein
VVVDAAGLQYLVPLFDGESFEIIYTRGEKLYLTPRLVWRTMKYTLKTASLSSSYVLAVLEMIRPLLVITFVDNSGFFPNAARLYKDARFIAIQNSSRYLKSGSQQLIPPIYLTELACFGAHEVEKFTKYGAYVGQFYPIGSLRDAYYRETSQQKAPIVKRELLMVSEFCPDWNSAHPKVANSNRILIKHLERFCKKTGKTFSVATASDPIENKEAFIAEVKWYLIHAGSTARIIPNCRKEFTTYREIDSSELSLGSISTALVEGIGRGNRCLFCNYTGDDSYDFPVSGLWLLKEPCYELFEERLLQLLKISVHDFKELLGPASKYVVNYDENMPTNVFLKKLVTKTLNKQT